MVKQSNPLMNSIAKKVGATVGMIVARTTDVVEEAAKTFRPKMNRSSKTVSDAKTSTRGAKAVGRSRAAGKKKLDGTKKLTPRKPKVSAKK